MSTLSILLKPLLRLNKFWLSLLAGGLLCLVVFLNFSGAKVTAAEAVKKDVVQAPPARPKAKAWKPGDKRRKVLLIGDSMIEGLTSRLTDYFESSGWDATTLVWYGSGTKSWCYHDTLQDILAQQKPDFVVFTSGTNELLMPYIRQRLPYIVKIKEALSPYRFAWVGPPSWTKDTGLNFLIDSTLSNRNYFLSKNLEMPRYKDGIHPNKEGNRIWADSLVVWMNNSYSDYFYLSTPDTFTNRIRHLSMMPTKLIFAKD